MDGVVPLALLAGHHGKDKGRLGGPGFGEPAPEGDNRAEKADKKKCQGKRDETTGRQKGHATSFREDDNVPYREMRNSMASEHLTTGSGSLSGREIRRLGEGGERTPPTPGEDVP